jgi:hypothetical protein
VSHLILTQRAWPLSIIPADHQVFLLTVRNRPWTQIRRASPPFCTRDWLAAGWRARELKWTICASVPGTSRHDHGPDSVADMRMGSAIERMQIFLSQRTCIKILSAFNRFACKFS